MDHGFILGQISSIEDFMEIKSFLLGYERFDGMIKVFKSTRKKKGFGQLKIGMVREIATW